MTDTSPRLTLTLGGDVSLAKTVAEQIGLHGPGWPFEKLKLAGPLATADLFTFNWESPVLPRGASPPAKGLVVPEELLNGLGAGLPPVAASLANNHVLDAGPDGVAATVGRLADLGVETFGAGPDEGRARALHVVEAKGLHIGFLGRTEDCPQVHGKGFPGPALIRCPQLIDDVTVAAHQCDCLVVHLHQGVEFVDWPGPHMVQLCRELIHAGARIVAAHHPHVPQGWERCGDGLIFYSLGNLVFDVSNSDYQRQGSAWTNRSFLAAVPVGRFASGEPTLWPYQIDPTGRPEPLAGAQAEELLAHVAQVSADLADESALHRHWRQTALRYLAINIRWAKDALDGEPAEKVADSFFARLAHDENRQWVRELFGQAEWVRRIHQPPWT